MGHQLLKHLGLPQHLRWGIHEFRHTWDKTVKSTKRRVESSQDWDFPHFSNQSGLFSFEKLISNVETDVTVILLGCTSSSTGAVPVPGWDLRIPHSPESPAPEADAFPKPTEASQKQPPCLALQPVPASQP